MISHIITRKRSNLHFQQFNVHHSMCIVYQKSITCMKTFCFMIMCASYNLLSWDTKTTNKKKNKQKTQQTVLGKTFRKTIKMIATCKNLINFRMHMACRSENKLRSWKELHKLHLHYISNLSSFYSIKQMLHVAAILFGISA